MIRVASDNIAKVDVPKDNVASEERRSRLLALDAVQQYYRGLWRSLESRALIDARELRTLGVTSSFRGEGVTTVAVHLALAAAEDGDCRVLLVDADFAQPSLQRVVDATVEPGLADMLRESDGGEAYLRESSLPNLFVLTAGKMNGAPSRAHDAMQLGAAIKECAADFDLVLFDMPPAGETSFSLRLAGLLDGLLLVVEANRVSTEVAQRTSELLTRAQSRVLGVILNKQRGPVSAPLRSRMFASSRRY